MKEEFYIEVRSVIRQTMQEEIKDIYSKMDTDKKEILNKFDHHKESICDPTRISFTKKIAKLEVKSGIFGIMGGAIVIFLKNLIKKANLPF